MALHKLGSFLEQLNYRNDRDDYGEDSVRGLSTQKMMTETKANLDGVKLTGYKLFLPRCFAYVPDTSRRGDKVSLAYNDSDETYLVSSISVVFRIKNEDLLKSEYLFMFFNRPEFDRFARFNSWGSAREVFSWDDMCDIDIDVPSIEIQERYVALYNGMLENQRCYERGLEDLKLACDAELDKLKHSGCPKCALGNLLSEVDVRNVDAEISEAMGINIKKEFMPSAASSDDLRRYKVVRPGQFAYSSMQTGRDKCIRIALHTGIEDIAVSPAYSVLEANHCLVAANYLMAWFSREENDRLGWFLSDASVRANLDLNRFFEIEVPLPDMRIQEAIVGLYESLAERKRINEQLKAQLKDLCPILIKGSIEEASHQ